MIVSVCVSSIMNMEITYQNLGSIGTHQEQENFPGDTAEKIDFLHSWQKQMMADAFAD